MVKCVLDKTKKRGVLSIDMHIYDGQGIELA